MEKPTTALLYSGGRDSIVLLHMCRELLDDIVVVWIDTRAAYEDTYLHMSRVQETVPHFHVARSDQPKDIQEFGLPTDIMPIRFDRFQGQYLAEKASGSTKLQSSFACCAKNIWIPIDLALKDLKIEYALLGSRQDESLTDKRWDREQNGITWRYPLRKWTLQMVQDYAILHKLAVPAYYAGSVTEPAELKSRDCWNCTGYLWERKEAIKNLPTTQKLDVQQRLGRIYKVLSDELDPIRGVLWI